MDDNFTDFTKNYTFDTWTSSGDISSSTDVAMPPAPPAPPHSKRTHARYNKYYGEPPAKRAAPSIRVGTGFKWNLQTLAAAADAVESGGKSPVSALNELGVRVAYRVLRQGGPAHCPSFNVAVTVADMSFEGCGHSKREARAAAARACLSALLARAGRVLPAPSPHQDFTSDEPHQCPVSEFQCLEPKVKAEPPPAPLPPPDVPNGKEEPAAPAAASAVGAGGGAAAALFGAAGGAGGAAGGAGGAAGAHKSPINVLYENYAGLAFTCTFGDGSPLTAAQAPLQLSHSMRFKVVCQIKDQKFEGYGSSKKLAKLAAARAALAALDEGRPTTGLPTSPGAAPALHQTLADHIAKLVNEKFNELMKDDLVHSKRKVLAGIVITTHNRLHDARVIAVTTGTKCVSGEHMSVSGRALNDCHAEVAARRCLQRHLYAQLLMYANQPDPRQVVAESDVEPAAGGGYRLKASRGVHLYVSTAPCGDGRIFSPHEHHAAAEPDKHPNRLARGQLRTKIESGEGTIPVKNCANLVQTWDGVMQGERLLTMSCSDKVARWCVCGLQGALLARLLRPVYLQSLVLGSLLHPHHMYRAICGRIETYISSLPPPFALHRPLLSRAASAEARTPARAPSFSVIWCCTMQTPEVVNATTGKLESGQPSLLCKQSMFARWQYLVKRLPLLPQDVEADGPAPDMPDNIDGLLYNEAKQMCPTYQLAKQRLIDAFDKAKLGRWIKRPLEQDQFVCEIADADPALLFAWAGPHPAAGAGRRPPARPAASPPGGRPATGNENTDTSDISTPDSKAATLRLPHFMAPKVLGKRDLVGSGRDGRYVGGDGRDDHNVPADVTIGDVGSRSLSYYIYRSNKFRINNNCHNIPNCNRSSISSRLLNAKHNEDKSIERKYRDVCDPPEEEWDDNDNLDDNNLVSYDHSNLSEDINIDACLNNKKDEALKVHQSKEDGEVKYITHKIQGVHLRNDKNKLWKDFYKNRQAKRNVSTDDTKETVGDISDAHQTACEATRAQCYLKDKNINYLTVDDRDSIRPRVLTKDTRTEECSEYIRRKPSRVGDMLDYKNSKENKLNSLRDIHFGIKEKDVNLGSTDVGGDRDVEDDSSDNSEVNAKRETHVINKMTAYYLSKYRDMGTNLRNYSQDVSVSETAGNKISYSIENVNPNPQNYTSNSNCSNSQDNSHFNEELFAPNVKSSMLLRRLHIYKKICTKIKEDK